MNWDVKEKTKKSFQKLAKSKERTWARHIKTNSIKEAPNSVSSLQKNFYLKFYVNLPKREHKIKF